MVQPTPEDVAALIQEKTSILAVIGKCVATGTTVAAGLRQALDAGAAVVQSDLENLRPAKMEESGKEFYFALASTLARQLHLPRSLREVWDEDLPGAANMHAFMRDEVLASARGHVVCVLNNVDMLLPCAFGNDVFGLIRAWHNSRPTDPAGNWEQLTVVLMCHSDPSRFITDQYQSPFNVGTWVIV